MFPNIAEKVELCAKMQSLRNEISSQLDKEHGDMLKEYDELWDDLPQNINIILNKR